MVLKWRDLPFHLSPNLAGQYVSLTVTAGDLIAVQIRSDDETARAALAPLADEQTLIATAAERSFLAALEGGCQVPIGALVVEGVLHGFIADIDGRRVVRGESALDVARPEQTGVRLASELRQHGASEILESLRRAEHLPSPQPE